MATISWTESLPSDGSKVGISPPEIRGHLVAMSQWLGEWLYFPGTGGGSANSAGVLKPGASRAFFAAASASSNAAPGTLNGRLFFTSDTSRLYGYDSTGTYRLGSSTFVERGNALGEFQYVFVSGQSFVVSPNNPERSFSFSSDGVGARLVEFASAPNVIAAASHGSLLFSVSAVTTGGFTSTTSWWGSGATSAYTVTWQVSGTTSVPR